MPEIPEASATNTPPDYTQAVKASEASLNVSAHQKIKPIATDEATFVLAVENKQPKLLAKPSATTTTPSSTAFDSQPDADNLSAKPSAMSDVPATVPAIINGSASETETTTATTTDKTNSPEITSPTPASSTQKSATNAYTNHPVTPASDETNASTAEHIYVSQPATDNKKTPAISRQVTTVKSNTVKPNTDFLPLINEQPTQHNEKTENIT